MTKRMCNVILMALLWGCYMGVAAGAGLLNLAAKPNTVQWIDVSRYLST